MDLLSLPSPAWALVAGHLPPEGVARLSATCKAANDRNEEIKLPLWSSILREELRHAAAGQASPSDPQRVFRDVRTLMGAHWVQARQVGDAPQPKNGGGLARLGNGPEIVLFGGSNHRISRASSDICNEVAVLRLTTRHTEDRRSPGSADQDADDADSSEQRSSEGGSSDDDDDDSSGSEPEAAELSSAPPAKVPEFLAEWDLDPAVEGDAPSPRWGHSCTSVVDPADGADAIFVYGGFGGGQILGDAHLLKRAPASPDGALVLRWEELRMEGDPPERCAFHSATEVAPGVIAVVGGLNFGCTSSNMVLADLAARRWVTPITHGVPRPARAGHAAAFVPVTPRPRPEAPEPAGSLLGHLWLVGGCQRTEVGEEDEFHTAACIVEVLLLDEPHLGAGNRAVAFAWLEEHDPGPVESVVGRCPLSARVGRHLVMWGGFFHGRPRHFQRELTILDTQDPAAAPRRLMPGVASAGGRAPEPREGGGCIAYADDRAVAMAVFGGATFDVTSDMSGVHLLVVSAQ